MHRFEFTTRTQISTTALFFNFQTWWTWSSIKAKTTTNSQKYTISRNRYNLATYCCGYPAWWFRYISSKETGDFSEISNLVLSLLKHSYIEKLFVYHEWNNSIYRNLWWPHMAQLINGGNPLALYEILFTHLSYEFQIFLPR